MAGMKAFPIICFLLTLLGANLAVTYLDPVSVGFGLIAPAGVYLVALTLAFRDVVQRVSGARGLAWAATGGVLLSFLLASSQVVWASVAAFAVSFLIDTAIYSLVWYTFRGKDPVVFIWALLLSGLVSLVPDTLIFCYLAGFPEFIPGQLLGKAYGTLLYAGWLTVDYFLFVRRAQKKSSVPSE